MSQELRDLAKKVMEKVESAVNQEDEAFRKALGFIREEIKSILGEEGDNSVGEAQSPNPTVAAPIWGQMGGPQPANATSPNAPMRHLGEENPDYSEQLPGNGQPELEDGQEPSASIPNAQGPISADAVAAIAGYGAAQTSGLGVEMAHSADSEASPEESATKIEGDEKPAETPEAFDATKAANEGATPDSGDSLLPSEQAIAGADAGTAVGEQKEAEAGGSPESGPLATDADKSESASEGSSEAPETAGLPTGGNSPETAPLESELPSENKAESEELDADGASDTDSSLDGDVGSDEETSSTGESEETAPRKRGRPKKKS